MTKKIRYDPISKIIDVKPFFEIVDSKEDDRPFIEMTYDEWENNLSICNENFCKAYIDGKIVEKVLPGKEDCVLKQNYLQEVSSLQMFLNKTDYIITKLQEYSLTDTDLFNSEKIKYDKVLSDRYDARKKIDRLQEKIQILENKQ